jgi:hypothetical protein
MAGAEIGMTKAPSLGCHPALPDRRGPSTVLRTGSGPGMTGGPQVRAFGFGPPA